MTATVTIVNIDGVTIVVYLSQDDIGRLLGVDRTVVNVWRRRYDDFPEEDARIGVGKRSIPGYLPERMDAIKAWVKAKGLKAPALSGSKAPAAHVTSYKHPSTGSA